MQGDYVSAGIGCRVPPESTASNSDEAFSDDVISLVTSSSAQLMMMLSHCVHLSCWQCHLVTFIPLWVPARKPVNHRAEIAKRYLHHFNCGDQQSSCEAMKVIQTE